MPKLALLLGVTGSGKSHVSERLKPSPQILTVDLIRTDAIRFLCTASELEKHNIYRWPIWDELLKRPDVHDGICHGIEKRCPGFDPNKATIAEGEMLAHAEFLQTFLQSLKQMQLLPDPMVTFWLDPEPQIVRRNVIHRGREGQKNYLMKDAIDSVKWYRGHTQKLECKRITEAADAISQIDAFFAS